MRFTTPIRIGTRKSALALAQTDIVVAALKKAHPNLSEDGAIEVVHLNTLGDSTQKQNLSLVEHGGKALWATEHEQAMRQGHVDCAVHSVKDIPGLLPEDMVMPCFLPRAAAEDVFLSPRADTIMDLPEGAIFGTSSPRRQAYVLSKRPDLKVVTFRGNVGSRLKKLEEGIVDGTFLALAGMQRAGYEDAVQTVMSPSKMIPAVGQGAIGIEFLKNRDDLADIFEAINCETTRMCIEVERAWLRVMDGSCRSPLAGYAVFTDDKHITLNVMAARLDGSEVSYDTTDGAVENVNEAIALGANLGQKMKAVLPPDFFEAA